MIIGLTGLYCAGKNHVGLLLEKKGLSVLDLDKLGHEVIRTEKKAIVRSFGEKALGADGCVNRRFLGKLVFGSPEALAVLEAIIHPVVNRLCDEWIAAQETSPKKICVLNAALLHRSVIYNRLDAIIVVKAPLPVRFFRAVKRDKLSPAEIQKRLFSQNDFPKYTVEGTKLLSDSADIYTIRNSGFPGSRLERRIDAILEGLCYGRK